MSNPSTSPSYIFNEGIDAGYMEEMYGNDYAYMEVIFKTVLDDLNQHLESIGTHYEQGHLEPLRKVIHKIKPAFGFIGMPKIQEKCQHFEDKCQQVTSANELEGDFKDLARSLQTSKSVINAEYQKLVQYNSSAV